MELIVAGAVRGIATERSGLLIPRPAWEAFLRYRRDTMEGMQALAAIEDAGRLDALIADAQERQREARTRWVQLVRASGFPQGAEADAAQQEFMRCRAETMELMCQRGDYQKRSTDGRPVR